MTSHGTIMMQFSSCLLSLSAIFAMKIFIISLLTSVFIGHVTAAFLEYTPFCLFECCQDKWINPNNATGLKGVLTNQLYGQHLVTEVVVSAVISHLTDPDPAKALVLSFHGPTGTGKNFVSRLIAESIYKKGMHSRYVHMFSANNNFPHKDEVNKYKDFLKDRISCHTWICPRQLFIFDEVEDFPEGLLDIIKPYLDYNQHVDGVDYRKAIFLMLSNTAASDIAIKVNNHVQIEGKKREEIRLGEMEEIIEKVSMNAGGFRRSRLIDHYVVSHFLPFLPLEKKHVRECIRALLRLKPVPERAHERIIDEVIEDLQFQPKNTEQYATKGCKNAAEKVNRVLYRMKDEL